MQELHARAGKALEATHPRQSIKHYLAAKLWSRAATQIERLGWKMIYRWDYQPLRAWIETIPEGERAVTPVLNLYLGAIHFLILEFDRGRALLERTLDGFSGSLVTAERNIEAEGFSWLAYCVWSQGDIKWSGEIFARALKLPAALDTRARLLAAVAIQKLMESTPASVAQAAEHFEELKLLAMHNETYEVLYNLASLLNVGGFATFPRAIEYMESLLPRMRKPGITNALLQAQAEHSQTVLELWRGRWDTGLAVGARAQEQTERLNVFLSVTPFGVVVVRAARGEYEKSDNLFAQALQEFGQTPGLVGPFVPTYLYALGRMYCLASRYDDARLMRDQLDAAALATDAPLAGLFLLLLQALLNITDREFSAAERALSVAVRQEPNVPLARMASSARLLLAYLYHEMKRKDEALVEFAPLLAECARDGSPYLVLKEGRLAVPLLRLAVEADERPDYAGELLGILHADVPPRPAKIPDSGETLSSREYEVLRLVSHFL